MRGSRIGGLVASESWIRLPRVQAPCPSRLSPWSVTSHGPCYAAPGSDGGRPQPVMLGAAEARRSLCLLKSHRHGLKIPLQKQYRRHGYRHGDCQTAALITQRARAIVSWVLSCFEYELVLQMWKSTNCAENLQVSVCGGFEPCAGKALVCV